MFLTPLKRFTKVVLVFSLISPNLAVSQMADPIWVFPGETLPGDVGYSPLKVSSGPKADVSVLARDWFLLKDSEQMISHVINQAVMGPTDYYGPVLDEMNGQLYYRIVSGMILRESLKQMGVSSMQARRFIDRAKEQGIDFDKTPLEEMGKLPDGLNHLYEEWNRPMARLAVLPYLALPLTIAYDQSNLQHFAHASLEGDTTKSCNTINTAAPLASIKTKIDEEQAKLDAINKGVRDAKGLYEQSNAELVRLTQKVKDLSSKIDKSMQCFDAIKDRVSRGDKMPSEECLSLAGSVLEEAKAKAQWEKFVASNLSNTEGDFRIKQAKETELKTLEARLAANQSITDKLMDDLELAKTERSQAQETLKKLEKDRENQKKLEVSLGEEQEALNQEYQDLQMISHKLERGTLGLEMTEAEVKQAIADTAKRAERIDAIKNRLPQILEEKSKLQANQGAISTQIEFLSKNIDTFDVQIASIQGQLGDGEKGLVAEISQLEEQVSEANQSFLEASDNFNFSEYIISILSRELVEMSQTRDFEFDLLKKEEASLVQYKEQIAKAESVKDADWAKVEEDLNTLKASGVYYLSNEHMGWFLEQDCQARQSYDRDGAGIYLARAPFTAQAKQGQGPVAGGQWGLFNMPYESFKNSVQSGALLNLPAYIELSVRNMFNNYDYSASQFLDPYSGKCNEIGSAGNGPVSYVLGLMRSAFAIWDEGSTTEAKASGYCRISENNNSVNRSFNASLKQVIGFKGSLLDQVLPKEGRSSEKDLLERRAIVALTGELGALTGLVNPSEMRSADLNNRREALIKSLIKVAAFDYDAAINKTQDDLAQKMKYGFATEAPRGLKGGNRQLKVGDSLEVMTLGQVELFNSPVAERENFAGITLSWGDKVKLLAAGNEGQATQAGWVKVQVKSAGNKAYWMPAWAISYNSLVDANGVEVYDLSNPRNCPVRRIVTEINNYEAGDDVITRLLPDIKTESYYGSKFSLMSWNNNTRTTPGSTNKLYVACELFGVEGELAAPNVADSLKDVNGVNYETTQGIRIVEVQEYRTSSGQIRYVPVETYGGFAHTWLITRNESQPRIFLGPVLSEKTWSLK